MFQEAIILPWSEESGEYYLIKDILGTILWSIEVGKVLGRFDDV